MCTCLCYNNQSFILSFSGNGKLDYDTFFNSKIKSKKEDNSYRRFRVLARSADQFPVAKYFSDTALGVHEGRDTTVWCSNDYLGMSKHPKVIEATR